MAYAGEPCAVAVRTKSSAGMEGESLLLMPFGDLDVSDAAYALQYVAKCTAVRTKICMPNKGESSWFLTRFTDGSRPDNQFISLQASANEQDRLGGQIVVTMCPSLRVMYRVVGQLCVATVRSQLPCVLRLSARVDLFRFRQSQDEQSERRSQLASRQLTATPPQV